MYCQKCGRQLDDEAVMCPQCGAFTANHMKQSKNQPTDKGKKFNWTIFKLIFGIVYLLNGIAAFGRDTAKMVVSLLISFGLLLWWFAKDWKPKEE